MLFLRARLIKTAVPPFLLAMSAPPRHICASPHKLVRNRANRAELSRKKIQPTNAQSAVASHLSRNVSARPWLPLARMHFSGLFFFLVSVACRHQPSRKAGKRPPNGTSVRCATHPACASSGCTPWGCAAWTDACCRQVPRPRHNRAFDGCIGHNMRHVLRPIHLPRCCTAPAR